VNNPLAFIVEDDPQLSQVFLLTLSKSFEVEAITDGAQAMARLSETVPHLIVLDINLPGVSGAQILHSIRADARFDSTRIILATADSRHAEALQDEVDVVLLKPPCNYATWPND
jgi:CheY-like chemotaxis protein